MVCFAKFSRPSGRLYFFRKEVKKMRKKYLIVPLTTNEYSILQQAAAEAHLPLAGWARSILFKEIEDKKVEKQKK